MKKDISPKDRYTGVLLERIESNVEKILEGHTVLDKRIDSLNGKLEEFRADVEWKFNILLGELKDLRGDVKDLRTGRITELEKRIEKLESKILR